MLWFLLPRNLDANKRGCYKNAVGGLHLGILTDDRLQNGHVCIATWVSRWCQIYHTDTSYLVT